VVAVAVVLLCSLALGASPEDGLAGGPMLGAVQEIWLVRQRIRWTRNDGYRQSVTYDGELRITRAGGQATSLAVVGGWTWQGQFMAGQQVWRDTTIKTHYPAFYGSAPWTPYLVGYLRPNAKWTRLTGRFSATAFAMNPAISWYGEGRLTATYSYVIP